MTLPKSVTIHPTEYSCMRLRIFERIHVWISPHLLVSLRCFPCLSVFVSVSPTGKPREFRGPALGADGCIATVLRIHDQWRRRRLEFRSYNYEMLATQLGLCCSTPVVKYCTNSCRYQLAGVAQ